MYISAIYSPYLLQQKLITATQTPIAMVALRCLLVCI